MATSPRTRFLTAFAREAQHGRRDQRACVERMVALVDELIAGDGLAVDRDALQLHRLHTTLLGQSDTDAGAPPALPPLPDDADAGLLGQAYEVLLDARQRHTRGVFYTPAPVAAHLVDLVLPAPSGAHTDDALTSLPRVLDPSVGGGAFLLAAGRALERRGWPRRAIVEHALWGIDIDPIAVAVTDAVLQCWMAGAMAGSDGRPAGGPTDPSERASHLVVADTLQAGPAAFACPPVGGFDAVVGNPPFQNQLGTATARRSADAEAMGWWLGVAPHRYADSATLFLAAAVHLARADGRVALVLPQSFLVADDAKPVRDAVMGVAELEHLWVALEPVFAAGVQVCAPVLHLTSRLDGSPADGESHASTLTRSTGRAFKAAAPIPVDRAALAHASTWAPLTADLFGVPPVAVTASDPARTLGSFCRATAGFRDQFYGIQPFVREAPEAERRQRERGRRGGRDGGLARWAPLVTAGLLGPAWCDWGARPTRFAKRRWEAPVVDLDLLRAGDPKLARWTADRLVPKVVIATQTRVIEAAVDEDGAWYPSVPTIALSCPAERLWHAAAVVMAPAITVWAFHRHAGAALTSDALKLSARQILLAPLPGDPECWSASAAELRRASEASRAGDGAGWRAAMERFAAASLQAYDVKPRERADVERWWLDRLPAVRTPTEGEHDARS